MIRLSCHGAARQVTGSCHLLETDHARVLIDCGFFQGGREIEEENTQDFGFDPRAIDAVLLTHAHLDHCGRLPLLTKQGFSGRIISTSATHELTRLVLMDSAGLQKENALHHARHARPGTSTPAVLYSEADVLRVMQLFDKPIEYGEQRTVAPGIRVQFINAGHILGSASIFIEIEAAKGATSILFSGDIGGPDRPLLADADPPPAEPTYVVMETTYGDRDHRAWEPSIDELIQAVGRTSETRGKTLIPTFALERAQELLYVLSENFDQGRLDRSLPIYLDSPMAISATEVFKRYVNGLRPEAAKAINGKSPFDRPNIYYTKDVSASKAINDLSGPAVIMAGSGMCTGGRIRHHLERYLGKSSTTLIFVGYASQGTPARHIIDGATSLRIFGSEIPVHAQVHTINGFSAHAGRSQLFDWLKRCGRPRKVFLVHGDYERGMKAFAELLTETKELEWYMPRDGETLVLNEEAH